MSVFNLYLKIMKGTELSKSTCNKYRTIDSVLVLSPKTRDANYIHIPKPGASLAHRTCKEGFQKTSFATLNQKSQDGNEQERDFRRKLLMCFHTFVAIGRHLTSLNKILVSASRADS